MPLAKILIGEGLKNCDHLFLPFRLAEFSLIIHPN
jgi:hypothetical protein